MIVTISVSTRTDVAADYFVSAKVNGRQIAITGDAARVVEFVEAGRKMAAGDFELIDETGEFAYLFTPAEFDAAN